MPSVASADLLRQLTVQAGRAWNKTMKMAPSLFFALICAENCSAKGTPVDIGPPEFVAGSADASDRDTGSFGAVLELQSFALYALSRGSGLSESGQRAIAYFRELLRKMNAEGHVVEVLDTRIGIEGETRICARFASPELAGKAWLQMQSSLVIADLVQLKPEKC